MSSSLGWVNMNQTVSQSGLSFYMYRQEVERTPLFQYKNPLAIFIMVNSLPSLYRNTDLPDTDQLNHYITQQNWEHNFSLQNQNQN